MPTVMRCTILGSWDTTENKTGRSITLENPLVAQWLGLGAFTDAGPGSIPGGGTKSPQGKQKKKKKNYSGCSMENELQRFFFSSPKGHVLSEWTDALVLGRVSSLLLWVAPRSTAFCHWLNKCIVSTCSLPGTVINTGSAETSKLSPCGESLAWFLALHMTAATHVIIFVVFLTPALRSRW